MALSGKHFKYYLGERFLLDDNDKHIMIESYKTHPSG